MDLEDKEEIVSLEKLFGASNFSKEVFDNLISKHEKVLILEDSEDRIKWFEENVPQATISDNVKDAILILNKFKPTLIFLDHDLNEVHNFIASTMNKSEELYQDWVNEPESGKTGYHVAKYMQENYNPNAVVIIHSMNPLGSKNMKNLLPEAYVVPFDIMKYICK